MKAAPYTLTRWQLTHLALALWAHEQGLLSFSPLAPALPIDGPKGPKPVGLKKAGPTFLAVKVPALPEADIPQHYLYLYGYDYKAAKLAMSPREREAWLEYIGKPRASALYGGYTRTRKRLLRPIVYGEPDETGYRRIVSHGGSETRKYFYLEPNSDLTPQLERAARAVLAVCDQRNLEAARKQAVEFEEAA